jgi:hypothetical protein
VLAYANSEEHPNLQYYIYKSIILNNLYGVDIMHEAVEIAKLRLFLKMVGAVDIDLRKPNFGLEPLPDIDFNIRTGNTLIGFATKNELISAIKKHDDLFAEEKLKKYEEECGIVATAYSRFQDSQFVTDKNTDLQRKTKLDLQRRLNTLNDKLNEYLASTYGIRKYEDLGGNTRLFSSDDTLKQHTKEYEQWLKSYQPFHWFADFYEIIHENGGFDVVIGNPPYVEYSNIKNVYKIKDYFTESCGNLYAYIIERSITILKNKCYNGMIVPISAYCTDRMNYLQILELNNSLSIYVSNFAERPSKLFEGAERNLSIALLQKYENNKKTSLYTTYYYKWKAENRKLLFSNIKYFKSSEAIIEGIFPKISTEIELNIIQRLRKIKNIVSYYDQRIKSENILFYRNSGGRYWKIITNFQPIFYLDEKKGISSRESYIYFNDNKFRDVVISYLNSSLYYWYYIMHSDARTNNPSDLKKFPIEQDLFKKNTRDIFVSLCKNLMYDLKKNSIIQSAKYKTGDVKFQQFFPARSKGLINEIDKKLAEYYKFTEEELDFIINYDIKYRMGKELFNNENEKE